MTWRCGSTVALLLCVPASAPFKATRAYGHGRMALVRASALGSASWSERELWALEDSVPRYALDAGRMVLWRRITLDVPELFDRSPEELRSRWLTLQGAPNGIAAENPPCLENWFQLEDGSYQGELHGVAGVQDGSLRATITFDRASAEVSEIAEVERWIVRSDAGDVFQLGRSGSEALSASGVRLEAIPPSVSGPATGAASILSYLRNTQPVMLGMGAVAAAAASWAAFIAGHHVDVSVFIV